MTSYWTLLLAVPGFLLLAASLAVKKRAMWCAVAGMALLACLAVRESDPTLALGALALVAARSLGSMRREFRMRSEQAGADARAARTEAGPGAMSGGGAREADAGADGNRS